MMSSPSVWLSCSKPSSRLQVAAPSMRSQALYGAMAPPCTLPFTNSRASSTTSLMFGHVGLLALDLLLAGHYLRQQLDRLVEELHRLEQPVGQAHLERLLAVYHAVVLQRVLDDELDRLFGADELRDQLGAAPSGHQAQEATLSARSGAAPVEMVR